MRERLYYTMRRKGYSQRELADAVGVSGATISRIINCKKNPSEKLLQKIANELDLTAEEVLSDKCIA